LGVSETATVDETVKPAPPIEADLPEVEGPPAPVFSGEFRDGEVILPDDVKNPVSVFFVRSDFCSNKTPQISIEIDEERSSVDSRDEL
jgi:hypothetical protein